MRASITGMRQEPRGMLACLRAAGATGNTHLSHVGKQANSLLPDGLAWKDSPARRWLERAAASAAVLEACRHVGRVG